ncbi:19249_t:CDS:2, partial [Racocetra fulgida]
MRKAVIGINWVYHLASDIGGMGLLHESNNFVSYRNNHLVTTNIVQASIEAGIDRFFYASSACTYSREKQLNQDEENDVWYLNNGSSPQGLYVNEHGYYEIELKNSDNQFQSFLYIKDCIDAIVNLMESDYSKPLNIGSDNTLSIRELAYIAFETIGIKTREQVKLITDDTKSVGIHSDTLINQVLGWTPEVSMEKTAMWIKNEIEKELNKCEN